MSALTNDARLRHPLTTRWTVAGEVDRVLGGHPDEGALGQWIATELRMAMGERPSRLWGSGQGLTEDALALYRACLEHRAQEALAEPLPISVRDIQRKAQGDLRRHLWTQARASTKPKDLFDRRKWYAPWRIRRGSDAFDASTRKKLIDGESVIRLKHSLKSLSAADWFAVTMAMELEGPGALRRFLDLKASNNPNPHLELIRGIDTGMQFVRADLDEIGRYSVTVVAKERDGERVLSEWTYPKTPDGERACGAQIEELESQAHEHNGQLRASRQQELLDGLDLTRTGVERNVMEFAD